jgi:hypothetical protein
MHVPLGILVTTLVCLVGCGFQSRAARIDASDSEGATDADVSDAGPCVSWNALNVMPCNGAIGTPRDLALPAGTYVLDTDSGQLSGAMTQQLPGALIAQAAGPMFRVVNIGQLSIANGAMVSITGTHALVFVVHADATIAGIVDVSARIDGSGTRTAGPGGDDSGMCAGGIGADGQAAMGVGGAGGAGGGGFGDTGGDGGDGNGDKHGGHGGHGNTTGNATIVPLRGGCPGGLGGAIVTMAVGGRAGNGGGALEVTALGVINVSGALMAAGSGAGTPTLVNGGGGAGGSGGAILLDGETIHVEASGALCANGGGGGEGGQIGKISAPGANGTCSTTLAASGGMIQTDGGDGGDGGRLGTTKGQPGANGGSGGGGGGGGGSVGRIRVRGRTTRMIDISAIVSPAATL